MNQSAPVKVNGLIHITETRRFGKSIMPQPPRDFKEVFQK